MALSRLSYNPTFAFDTHLFISFFTIQHNYIRKRCKYILLLLRSQTLYIFLFFWFSCSRFTRILRYHSGYVICDGVALSSHADEIYSRIWEVLTLFSREQPWVGQKTDRGREREREMGRKEDTEERIGSILSLNS